MNSLGAPCPMVPFSLLFFSSVLLSSGFIRFFVCFIVPNRHKFLWLDISLLQVVSYPPVN